MHKKERERSPNNIEMKNGREKEKDKERKRRDGERKRINHKGRDQEKEEAGGTTKTARKQQNGNKYILINNYFQWK